MKIKNFLPQIITAVVSILSIICAFLFSKVAVKNFPFSLYEKMGMYFHSEDACVITNETTSLNGTHEIFISILKKFAFKDVIILNIVPAILFCVLIFVALLLISDAASKTEYKQTSLIAAVLLPIVFLDFSNTSYFKTMYINPLILTLLLLICAVFLQVYKRNSAGIFGIITTFILTLFYIGLGNVQAITAIVIGILIIRLYKIAKNHTAKILSVVLGVVIILQSFVFSLTFKPYNYKQHLYNSVFLGIAKYDRVTVLGLDKKLDDFSNVYYGMNENEAEYDLENTFYSKVSYSDVIKYYVTHPVKAIKIINEQIRLSQFDEYDYGFAPYSNFRKALSINLLYALIIVIAYVKTAWVVGKKHKHLKAFTEFLSGITIMWFISIIATSIYCGNSDIPRNMYTSNILFDIMFLSGLICGLRIVIYRQNEKKKEFGITHE